ncbi:hypothetical protein LTR56_017731 [Elasticomyces elasticus]|nr:hypothetical protein LTR56_017731 [Elasticomyces elasticus]KAK4915369.1 hypothetical protein LTR49_016500 [Elasticomyces elasticus]
MVGREQKLQLTASMPSLEGYWRLGMETSAVKLLTATLRYTCEVQLPIEIQDSKLLNDLYEAANGLTSVKEVAAGASSSNILFILYAATGSIDATVQASLDLLQKCSDNYETCVARLLAAYDGESALKQLVMGTSVFLHGQSGLESLNQAIYGVETGDDGEVVVQM